MATKVYCDRCENELDMDSGKYVHVYFMNFEDKTEDYDFCIECAESIKRSMMKNIFDYKMPTLEEWTTGEYPRE